MIDIQKASEIVMLTGEQVVTDSKKVAEAFGKQHAHVLRSIRKAIEGAPDDSAKSNFGLCFEINDLQNGKPQPYYLLTKDGFMAVALAFTGQAAAAVRWAFIRAFNQMAEFIRVQADGNLRRWEAAYLEYRNDQNYASRCGTGLVAWKNRKPAHLARLEQLDPQLKLPLLPRSAA
ncbi:Rha family transcriptional regulator [Xanthomonas sp. NCPPB 3005]|uniref:Rha family transcriptional regulator n=1 Tax=Xanthomonas sp. NCPPB 3005 TaxID=3240913 RepID=UPI003512234F